jgi:hypothetical protein
MNSETQLNASMWLMIAVRTIGAIDLPGHGPRKLPAPKVYVAIIILWSIFGLIADAGQQRAAAIMSWVTVLTAAVMGPFGNTAISFLKLTAQTFAIPNPTPQGETLV